MGCRPRPAPGNRVGVNRVVAGEGGDSKMIDGPAAQLKVRSNIASRIPADQLSCTAHSTTAIERVLADAAANWEASCGAGVTVSEVLVVEDDEDLRESLVEALGAS